MTPERLRFILSGCAIVCTLAACTFVAIKSRNDGSIAKDTARIAASLEYLENYR